jgi:hypothetical protein
MIARNIQIIHNCLLDVVVFPKALIASANVPLLRQCESPFRSFSQTLTLPALADSQLESSISFSDSFILFESFIFLIESLTFEERSEK